MNRVTGLFLLDWRRKLLALGIGFLIWSWVAGQISVDRDVTLILTVSDSDVRDPSDFYLSVEVPEGWVLTDPPAGQSVRITLNGSNSEYNDFISRQCAASIGVDFDVDPIQDIVDYPVTPKNLVWVRPSDAAFLLNGVTGVQELQNLTFQRVQTKVLSPNVRDVTIVGKPSDAHDAKVNEMVFLPSQITLSGPKLAMQKLTAQIDDTYSANGSLENSGLFASMTLGGNERGTITKSLRLAKEWSKRGIQMEPRRVMLELPVRLREVKNFQWLPDASDLIVLPADDEASSGPWTIEASSPTQWIAEMPDMESDLELNAQWIEAHVELLLHMNTLNVNSLDRTSLPIEANLYNFDDPAELSFFRKYLTIRPLDPGAATVTVTRNP